MSLLSFHFTLLCHSIRFSWISLLFAAGRKIAIDASMSLYQFLIAVRSEGVQLTSVDGETTSHLMGMFYRTIRMLDNGIKPVYVPVFLPFAIKLFFLGFYKLNFIHFIVDMFLMESRRS